MSDKITFIRYVLYSTSAFFLIIGLYAFAGVTPMFSHGASMSPNLSFVLCIEQTAYAKGDVVMYVEDGQTIHHRIWGMNGTHVQTKGDNNNHYDPIIKKDQILCRSQHVFGMDFPNIDNPAM